MMMRLTFAAASHWPCMASWIACSARCRRILVRSSAAKTMCHSHSSIRRIVGPFVIFCKSCATALVPACLGASLVKTLRRPRRYVLSVQEAPEATSAAAAVDITSPLGLRFVLGRALAGRRLRCAVREYEREAMTDVGVGAQCGGDGGRGGQIRTADLTVPNRAL